MGSVRNMKLTTVDDLFSTEESRQMDRAGDVSAPPPSSFQQVEAAANTTIAIELPLSEFHYFKGYPALESEIPFAGQPYHIREDDPDFIELLESVKQNGIYKASLARPDPDGGYEIIEGHRRHRVSEILGIPTFRAEIRQMTDEEAVNALIDTNIHRENTLPSEKAWAYRMKMEATKRQGARTDLTCGKLCHKSDSKKSRDIIAKLTAASARTIQNYIRLTHLIPELLKMVDDKKLKFGPAITLSYLKPSEQQDLWDYIHLQKEGPTQEQADLLRDASDKGDWNLTVLAAYMAPTKAESTKAVIKMETLDPYWQRKTPKEAQMEIMSLANTAAKLRQYTLLFPENITHAEFEQRLIELAKRANQQRAERDPSILFVSRQA